MAGKIVIFGVPGFPIFSNIVYGLHHLLRQRSQHYLCETNFELNTAVFTIENEPLVENLIAANPKFFFRDTQVDPEELHAYRERISQMRIPEFRVQDVAQLDLFLSRNVPV